MKDKLTDLYSSLPQHKAPDKVWAKLEEELEQDRKVQPLHDQHSHGHEGHSSGKRLWLSIAATLILGTLAISISLIQPKEQKEEVSLEKKLPDQNFSEEAEVMYRDELLLSREEQIQQLTSIDATNSPFLLDLQANWERLITEDSRNVDSEEANAILSQFSDWLMKHPEVIRP